MVKREPGRGSVSPATGLPKSVRLLHLSIPVVRGGTTDADSLGEWHANKAEIHYDPAASESVLRETILHEVLHAICEHTGIDPDEHESIIRSLSPLLLHVLTENPRLTRWLVGD
jgi:hypothetical protein